MLEVQGLCAGYGTSAVLFGIDLAVGAGEIVGVLGRNGMGKTTLVRSILGLVRPGAGSIAFDGRPIRGLAPNAIARAGIALVPEGRQIFPNLSVDEHLSAFQRASPTGQTRWTPQRAFDLFPRLQARRNHMGHQLSGGEQQMLAIARALMSRPRLLLLDEPSLGLAPMLAQQIFRAIRELNTRDRLTVFLVEQNAFHALKLAHRGYVIVNGEITLSGTGRELLARPEVRAAYLEGGRHEAAST